VLLTDQDRRYKERISMDADTNDSMPGIHASELALSGVVKAEDLHTAIINKVPVMLIIMKSIYLKSGCRRPHRLHFASKDGLWTGGRSAARTVRRAQHDRHKHSSQNGA